ncbi:MAG TPA: phosphatidate cytidylyltransferase [Candidatus Obscuribacterales bacterium]
MVVKSRIVYGWALFSVAIALLLAGGLAFATFFCVLAVLGANEYIGLVKKKGLNPSPRIIRGMSIAFFVVAASQMIVPHIPHAWHVNLSPFFAIEHFPILLTIGVCISFFRLLFRHEDPPATTADIATTILGFIYAGWLPCHLVLLRNLVPPAYPLHVNPLVQTGVAYVWVCLFIVCATDVFAYYGGKFLGKHLLYPSVSPNKTIEGAICGFVGSIFWATVVVYLSDTFLFPEKPFLGNLWQAPLMGAFVSVGSQLGDLCESLLKRDAGVKDSGTIFPGHGGILDRGDGLIFASALSYYWICTVVFGVL